MSSDLSITLRKNKLDLEHQELLQRRSAVWVVETGFPFSVWSIAISQGWHLFRETFLPLLIVSAVFLACLENYRREINNKIRDKQNEIDTLT
jgi:hypothetical protein